MKKILIVDDENEIRQLLKDRLEKSFYIAVPVENGETAVAYCKKDKPDLILLDIAMPGLNGYETCEKLRQHESTKDIPVIFLTGKDLESDNLQLHCESLCASGCISKFSSLKDLLVKIKEVIG